MAKSVGKSLRIFKTEMKGMSDDDSAREAHKAEVIEPAADKASVPPADRPADDSGSGSDSTKPSAD
jgi:sec-independent protein translocase protein TatA